MKIRASYGELGANFIDSYSFLSTAYGQYLLYSVKIRLVKVV